MKNKKIETKHAFSIILTVGFFFTLFLLSQIKSYTGSIEVSINTSDVSLSEEKDDWSGKWTYGSDGGTNGVIEISKVTSKDFVFSLDNFLDSNSGGSFGTITKDVLVGEDPVAQKITDTTAIFTRFDSIGSKETKCVFTFTLIKKDILNVSDNEQCSNEYLYEGVYTKKTFTQEPKELTLRYLLATNAGLTAFYNDDTIAICPRCDLTKENLQSLPEERNQKNKYWIVPKTVFPRGSDIRYPDFVVDNKINPDWAMIDYVWTRNDILK